MVDEGYSIRQFARFFGSLLENELPSGLKSYYRRQPSFLNELRNSSQFIAQICLSRDSLNCQTSYRSRKVQNSVYVQRRCKRKKYSV